jgi:hypothetical protein
MGWEVRRGQRYYYRSVRVHGKVRKEYVGRGARAEQLAQAQAERQRSVGTRRKLRHECCALLRRLDRDLSRYWRQSDTLVRGALLAAGYHYHRGEWRHAKYDRSSTN